MTLLLCLKAFSVFVCFLFFSLSFFILFFFLTFHHEKSILRFNLLLVAHAVIALLHVKSSHMHQTVAVGWKMAKILIFFPVVKEMTKRKKKNISFYGYPLRTMLLSTPFESLKCINVNIVFSSWFSFFFGLVLNYNLKLKYSLRWPKVSISDFQFIFIFCFARVSWFCRFIWCALY